ncbi:hypothetical protein [Xanthomonas phage XPP8]|nr:hypothetical protein KEM12_gp74 [Xanthomonas phage XPV1]AVO23815.1 hypothetical protein [Xanthomonas phage XPP3]AVO23942.1 hypothetical protein [Xanthomonas phage XPP6]AVO24081.1 hypothetical protein [Xanthomonas phage XPP8]AVO24312.1 hypothetical protein [Xanthomonas phage XPV2]QRI46340.1 hypothetical protein [Xanthomonas phage X2]UUR56294.1 hypothetical protein [Xanthomonas phage pXoo2107]
MTKYFRNRFVQGTVSLDEAVLIGWDDIAAGSQELDRLAIGDSARDNDGEYWERVS